MENVCDIKEDLTLADWQPGSVHGVLLSADAKLGRVRSTIWLTRCTKLDRDVEKMGPRRSTTHKDTADRDKKGEMITD